VEKLLPLVRSATALNEPVPLPSAVRSLFRFLMQATGARDGVLLVRSYDPNRDPAEVCQVYDAAGNAIAGDLAPFARSVAGSVVSLQEPQVMNRLGQDPAGSVELQPFERNRKSLLAAPMSVAPGIHAVLELFDKQRATPPGAEAAFDDADRRLVGAAADLGAEMLRQALAERQAQTVLFDAVEAALGASESVAQSLHGSAAGRQEEPPPLAVMDRLRQGLSATATAAMDADETLRLAEAIRILALRHGPPAVEHCRRLVESLRTLLDTATGTTEARP